jgi:hypothetical protein
VRLTGAAGAAAVAATPRSHGARGRLHVVADVRHGPGGLPIDEGHADDALGHFATTLAYALGDRLPPAPRVGHRRAAEPDPDTWDAPSPPPAPPRGSRSRRRHAETTSDESSAAAEAPLAPRSSRPRPCSPPRSLPPRRTTSFQPGRSNPPEEHRRPWVRAGVAAAAGLAMLRILRSRR